MSSVDPLQELCRAAREHENPSAEDFRAVRGRLLERIAVTGLGVASVASSTGAAKASSATLAAALVGKHSVVVTFLVGLAGGAALSGAVGIASRAPSSPGREPAAGVAKAGKVADARSKVRVGERPGKREPTPPASVRHEVESVEPTPARAAALTHREEPLALAEPAPSARSEAQPARRQESARPEASARTSLGASRYVDVPSAKGSSFEHTTTHLGDEVRGLGEAQRALRDRQPARALELLDRQDRSFAEGALLAERLAARVVALCDAGQVHEARRLAAQFLRTYPGSPLRDRVRGVCVP